MNHDSRQHSVIMIRHAQSEWNRQGRFTGWADPPLTGLGRGEAARAGETLARAGYRFDRAYTSRLARAQETAARVLQVSGNADVPVAIDWRLNERHYGALQGEDKASTAGRVGEQQVWRWRRGYLDQPPALADTDPRHPARQAAWDDIPRELLPNGENLAQTGDRVMAFWNARVVPEIRRGTRLLIASHGNTLRALLQRLQGMSIDEVESFEIPTGEPIVCTFTPDGRFTGWNYLADARRAA